MLLVLTAWCVVGACLVGIGLVAGRCVDRTLAPDRPRPRERPASAVEALFSSFWLGFSALILYLQLCSFLWPIGWPALVGALAVGLLGLTLDREILFATTRASFRSAPLAAFLVVLLAVWLANHALGQCMHLDTGIYHMQAVRWATTYPVVPGLAQLHGRFGFNNASHLFAAMLEVGPLYGRSRHVVNGLFLLVLAIPIARSARRLWSGRGGSADWFAILLVPALCRWASGKQLNSLSTDLPVDVIAMSAAWMTLRLAGRRSSASRVPGTVLRIEREALTVIAMMAAAVCVKLSTLPYAVTMSLLAVGASSQLTRSALLPRLRFGVASAVVAAALIGTWAARGIVLTGYPAYPIAIAGLPVEWKIPEERVNAMASLVRSWAREPGRVGSKADPDGRLHPVHEDHGDGAIRDWASLDRWLTQYARTQWPDFLGPLALAVLGATSFGVARLLGAERSKPDLAGHLLAIPAITAIVVWFLSAPAPRFASYAFWTLGAATMAQAVSSYAGRARKALSLLALTAGFALALAVLATSGVGLWQAPGRAHGFWPVPRPKLITASMTDGLRVRLARHEFCWDAPLPCAPTRPQAVAPQGPDLRSRRPGDLGSGFVYGPSEESSR